MAKRVVIRFARATWRYKGLVFVTCAAMLVASFADLASPVIYKQLVDAFSQAASQEVIAAGGFMLALLLVVKFLNLVATRLVAFATARLEPRVMMDLTDASFGWLVGHSYQFFADTFTGSLVKKVNRYSRSYERMIDDIVFSLVPTAIFLLGGIGILYFKKPLFALIFAAWLAIVILFNYLVAKWKLPLDLQLAATDSKMGGALADVITNSSTITFFANAEHEKSTMRSLLDEWLAVYLRAWTRAELSYTTQGLLMFAIEVILLVSSYLSWKAGTFTVGDFVLVQTYLAGVFGRTWNIGRVMRHMYECFADASEMVEILETPHDIRDVRGAKELRVTDGAIEFKNMTFNYHETRTVFKKLSLNIEPHTKVAFVGSSGAGKTTLVKLILRLYDVTGGKVLIDGQDISKVTQESLRRSIAFVPQEPILFHRSLMDNIRYGRLDASDDEVYEAAKRAQIHDFIVSLEQGYDTFVGERGVKLSGGERQRIAIARAILKNAPILILDEATSSLDSESEHLIQKALAELMKGKTTIAIAHRLSTIMQMDTIIVIENGQIQDSGTHRELLSRGGIYDKLWKLQAGGFLQA